MIKAQFSAIGSILNNGPSFYDTDGQANLVTFDYGRSSDTCLRNLRTILYIFDLFS